MIYKNNRILVTGMGVISCVGNNVEDFFAACIKGESGIKKIESFDTSTLNTKIAGCIENFNAQDYMDFKDTKRYSLSSKYAIAAALEALKDANLLHANRKPMGCIMGTGLGGYDVLEKNLFNMFENQFNVRKLSPFFIPSSIPNMLSASLSIHYQLGGPSFTINTACASSSHAIHEALMFLKTGDLDMILVGGSESAITPATIGGFSILNALSKNNQFPKEASRPFDLNRDGFVLSEGAAIFVLETEESVLKRKVDKIYGEIIGGAISSDYYHMTHPHPKAEGIISCFEQIFKSNHFRKEDVNYINSHATGTKIGDSLEQFAIKEFFGTSFAKENIKINATKSIIGHALGAAGAIEAITVLKSIEKKKLHPTINYKTFDQDCDLMCLTESIDFDIKIALSNSFGFGGQNAILAFQKYPNFKFRKPPLNNKNISKLSSILDATNLNINHFQTLAKNLNLEFNDFDLFINAFIHVSFTNENETLFNFKLQSNEKLELLGDSVLSFIVIKYLYKNLHHLKEGELSQIKSFIVSENSLSEIARSLNLGDYLILGKGERLGKINKKNRLLCDVLEALIGSIYLDQDISNLEKWLLPFIEHNIEKIKNKNIQDYKTTLQILIQKETKICPIYVVNNSQGPDHQKIFIVDVLINNNIIASGKGKSKKKAEQDAAYYALKKLDLN